MLASNAPANPASSSRGPGLLTVSPDAAAWVRAQWLTAGTPAPDAIARGFARRLALDGGRPVEARRAAANQVLSIVEHVTAGPHRGLKRVRP